jgi:hypothetical protein
MAFTEWTMQGVEFVNCNCAWGCPCQFNSLPTYGDCRALVFGQNEQGRYANVPLDGLRWGALLAWPKAIHLGNGTIQAIVDERADTHQRAALEAIIQGRDTDPGTLIWQVFATTMTTVLPTLFKPIELALDVEKRTASVRVPGLIEGRGEPIRNPVTGKEHRARINLPAGFEYSQSEVASGTSRATGAIALDLQGTHAHLTRFHWSTHGVVR